LRRQPRDADSIIGRWLRGPGQHRGRVVPQSGGWADLSDAPPLARCRPRNRDQFRFPAKPAIRFFVVMPIVLPGIVTGVAMLSFFSMLGWPLSRWTIIIAHGTFCITLILNNVEARLGQLPRRLDEASADLGASPNRTFWRVTFPLIRPAILAGAILAFTLSFDEVVVTFFLTGREKTLPLLIWGRLRQGISPEINAAATIIIGVSLAGVLLSNRLSKQAALGG
jgi:spermidine/putrescine transport system permease protein